MHNARRKAAVQHGVSAPIHRIGAEPDEEGNDAGKCWRATRAPGRPTMRPPLSIVDPVAPSGSPDAESQTFPDTGAFTGVHGRYSAAKTALRVDNSDLPANRDRNGVFELLPGEPHGLPSRMHLDNWHGAPRLGTNQ
jgi:hypothetical protein